MEDGHVEVDQVSVFRVALVSKEDVQHGDVTMKHARRGIELPMR